MNNYIFYWIITNIVGFFFLGVSYFNGWIDLVLASDQTYISVLIFVVFLWGLILSGVKVFNLKNSSINSIKWFANILVLLGLIGTVIGFIIALSGVDPSILSNIDKIGEMVALLIAGMGTALYTTLIGSLGNLWLMSVYFILSEGKIDD